MKKLNKLTLLIGVGLMSITACSRDNRFYLVETSDSPEYQNGECYQVSKNDIVDAVYLISMPSDEVNKDGEPIYDITWNTNLRLSYVSLKEGLQGKSVYSIKRHTAYVLKVTLKGAVTNPEATFGYIKVSSYAYTAQSSRAKETTSVYAYVAIGDEPGRATKPANV